MAKQKLTEWAKGPPPSKGAWLTRARAQWSNPRYRYFDGKRLYTAANSPDQAVSFCRAGLVSLLPPCDVEYRGLAEQPKGSAE